MEDKKYFQDYMRSFQGLYSYSRYSLSCKKDDLMAKELYRIMHGNLCRYTKDLLNALVCFRNSFEEGKPFIQSDISSLQEMLEESKFTSDWDPNELEVVKSLVLRLKDTYESICKIISAQDFWHL